MTINTRKLQSSIARCLYTFLLDGTMKAYGVILEATVNSFNTQRVVIGPVFTLQSSIGYLIAPLVKLLEGFLNPRLVAILGGVLATAGFVCRALIPVASVWYLLMCLSVSGIGFGLVNFVTLIGLKESFKDAYPSAYTISMFPTYIGIASLPPLLGYLMKNYGEKEGLFVFGMISSLLIITGMFTPVDDESPSGSSNAAYDEVNDEEANDKMGLLEQQTRISENETELCKETGGTGYWLSLLTQHPEFACLILIGGVICFEYISWTIYLVPCGEDLGLDSSTAVWLSTVGGLSGMLAKLVALIIFRWDKLVLPLGVTMPSILLIIAYSVRIFVDDFNALVFMASLSGFSLSLSITVTSGWLPKTVCEYHFKGAVTLMYFVGGIVTVLAGLITGAVADIAGHYRPAFAMLAVLNIAPIIVSMVWYLCFFKSTQA